MLADNLGFGDLSVYNGGIRGNMRTPSIDKLVSEGLRLTQSLVEPGFTPSREGLQTGRYSVRSGLSLVIPPGKTGALAAEVYSGRTVQECRLQNSLHGEMAPGRKSTRPATKPGLR